MNYLYFPGVVVITSNESMLWKGPKHKIRQEPFPPGNIKELIKT